MIRCMCVTIWLNSKLIIVKSTRVQERFLGTEFRAATLCITPSPYLVPSHTDSRCATKGLKRTKKSLNTVGTKYMQPSRYCDSHVIHTFQTTRWIMLECVIRPRDVMLDSQHLCSEYRFDKILLLAFFPGQSLGRECGIWDWPRFAGPKRKGRMPVFAAFSVTIGETLVADGSDFDKVSEGKTRSENTNPRPPSEKLSLRYDSCVLT